MRDLTAAGRYGHSALAARALRTAGRVSFETDSGNRHLFSKQAARSPAFRADKTAIVRRKLPIQPSAKLQLGATGKTFKAARAG